MYTREVLEANCRIVSYSSRLVEINLLERFTDSSTIPLLISPTQGYIPLATSLNFFLTHNHLFVLTGPLYHPSLSPSSFPSPSPCDCRRVCLPVYPFYLLCVYLFLPVYFSVLVSQVGAHPLSSQSFTQVCAVLVLFTYRSRSRPGLLSSVRPPSLRTGTSSSQRQVLLIPDPVGETLMFRTYLMS